MEGRMLIILELSVPVKLSKYVLILIKFLKVAYHCRTSCGDLIVLALPYYEDIFLILK